MAASSRRNSINSRGHTQMLLRVICYLECRITFISVISAPVTCVDGRAEIDSEYQNHFENFLIKSLILSFGVKDTDIVIRDIVTCAG